MIDFKKLVNYGITKQGGSNDYMFSYKEDGRVKCPIMMRNRKHYEGAKSDLKWIDLRDNRQKPKGHLFNGLRSKNQQLFWTHLREGSPGVWAIQEYLIPITDPELWKKCLEKEGWTKEKLLDVGGVKLVAQRWYQSYISADLYLPRVGWIIELDDPSHKYPGIDRARDKYVFLKYGIKTQRFMNYSSNNKGGINLMKEYFNPIGLLDFSEIAIDKFKEDYSDCLGIVKELEGYDKENPTEEDILESFPGLEGNYERARKILYVLERL